MPDRPLERGHWRRISSAPEAGSNRRRFRSIRLARAVAVRDDHADIARREPRIVERTRDGAGEAVAVVANGEQSGRLGRIASPQYLPQHGRVAFRRGAPGLERERARTFAENAAASGNVERTDGISRKQS